MSTLQVAPNLDVLVSDLFASAGKARWLSSVGWGIAFTLHGVLFGIALQHQRAEAPLLRPPVEVELAPPPPPPPPPVEKEPEPPAPKEVPAEPKQAAPARVASAPPPAPARAGALHTAKEDPNDTSKADDPLDFTHDPNVTGYGAGVVAIGGTAAFGVKNAAPAPVHAAAPSATVAKPSNGEALTAAADLGRKPALGESDPCRGYFPGGALDDAAETSVLVVVGKTGAVSKVTLVSENPKGQGFGAAARACMSSKRFTPALDRDGNPAATAIRVNVRFTR